MAYLFRCVFLKSGKPRLVTVSLGPRLVCIVSFLDAAVVRNVLTLGVHSVQLKETIISALFKHQKLYKHKTALKLVFLSFR